MGAKLPAVAEQPTDSDTAAALRALRPPAPTRIERRVAIAAILGARDQSDARVRVGRLEIEQKLGEGAMGIVYRAFDPELERTVAVKVLRQQAEEQQRRRLRAEARALARLNHPCVVGVYGLESVDGDTFVSMEYVPGGTLRKWLDTHPQARWREVLALFLQAAEGLAAAHDAGVIHQDFKPENVLVGQDGRVRVADFGMAWFDVAEAKEGATSSRLIGGTPHFMAPEVAIGALPSRLSDQYSLCVALRDALRDARVEDPAERQALEQVRRALERGLERDPDRRWPDIRALGEALSRQLSPAADQHQRSLLMERVEQLWLRGVLSESLSGTEPGSEPLAIRLEALFPEDLERISLPPAGDLPDRRSRDAERLRFARRVEARSVLELDDLFDASGRRLAIVGAAGAGKTTALLALTRSLLRRAQADFHEPVPVVLALGTFEAKLPLSEWMVAELHTKYGLPSRWARLWLQQGALVPMLDGLDEVPAVRQRACVGALNAFLEVEASAGCALTCRELTYADLEWRPEVGATIRVAPVHEALALSVLGQGRATALLEHWPRDAQLRELLSSPLMLRVAARADIAAVEVTRSAQLRRLLYAHFVAHLLARASDVPESRERLARGYVALAQAMIRSGSTDLWLERLQSSWLEQAGDRRLARTLGVLAVALGIFIPGTLAQLASGLPASASVLGSALAVLLTARTLRSPHIQTVEGIRWGWRRALRWLPAGLIGGALVGALFASRYWFGGGDVADADEALRGLFSNLGYGALLGLFGAFAMGLEAADQATRAEPGAGLRDSLGTALAVAIPGALVSALGSTQVLLPLLARAGLDLGGQGAAFGVAWSGLVGLVLFFVYGGAAVTRHWVLRWVLALKTPLPRDLVTFLDIGAHAGILRRVGGGYLFMHRTLRDYFASLDDDALKLISAARDPQRALTPERPA
ncbi:MAG: protein kinase [Polyangiaceae bacterium]